MLALLRSWQATWRFARGLVRNPRQAVVDAPFLIQLVLLPFLLVFEMVYKRLYPEKARRNQALFKRNEAAAKVFQSRLNHVALYREGRTIVLCEIVRFEVSEHLVSFDAEPVAHAGFSEGIKPWRFSINWDYFFYDAQCWAADNQFVRWRINFDDERIEKLKAFARTLATDLDANERYRQLNHFFIYEKAAEATHPPEVVEEALAVLKDYIESGVDPALLGKITEALKADTSIMSPHAFPGEPDSLEKVVIGRLLIERPGRCVVWIAMHPNPWRLEFSEDAVVRWRESLLGSF